MINENIEKVLSKEICYLKSMKKLICTCRLAHLNVVRIESSAFINEQFISSWSSGVKVGGQFSSWAGE